MADVGRARVAGVFGRAAAEWDAVIPFFSHFGARLVDLLAPRPGERVLDVAAGRGASVFPAAERVGSTGTVLGVDLAPEMVTALAADIERLGVANASARCMDACSLDLPDHSFDVVVCGFSLHVLPEPAVAAAEFLRVLVPGGRCGVAVPTGAGQGWGFFGELAREFAPRFRTPLPPRPPSSTRPPC